MSFVIDVFDVCWGVRMIKGGFSCKLNYISLSRFVS